MDAQAETPDERRLPALLVGPMAFFLEQERVYRIGSAPDCDLRLRHASVLPLHATVARVGLGMHLTALGPVTVDGAPCNALDLVPGMLIRAGAVELHAAWLESLPAAAQPVPAAAAAITAPVRTHAEPGFAELMAAELRHAPWLLVSLALHAIAFLLLWLLLPVPPPPQTEQPLLFDLVERTPEPDLPEIDRAVEAEIETTPLHELPPEVALLEPPAPAPRPREELNMFDDPEPMRSSTGSGEGLFQRIKAGGEDDVLRLRNPKIDSGGFRRTVTELRRSGLEIAFVVDSTGSMGGLLSQAKARIAEMIDVLHALVPDARIAIVTYRDHGEEDYLTRELALCDDHYRAINFLQFVDAGGGGDHPEAVDAGLAEAFAMKWRPGARRVVVLIGDAPPHAHAQANLLGKVKSFTRDGHSHVHTIATGARRSRENATTRAFDAIAKTGRGQFQTLGDDREILRSVLALSFGSEFTANLDEVWRIVAERQASVPDGARRLAKAGRREELAEALRDDGRREDLLRAIRNEPRQASGLALADVLFSARSSPEARHACAHALQQLLALPLPPIDPNSGVGVERSEVVAAVERLKRS